MKFRNVTIAACSLIFAACFNTAPIHDSVRRFIPSPDASRVIVPVADVPAAGLRDVVLPEYLASSKIAVRTGGAELVYSDANLWGEPLSTSVTRVLAQRMRLRAGAEKIDVFPWKPGVARAAEIRVEFDAFEGDADGSIHVSGRFVVKDSAKDGAATVYPFACKGSWTAGDYTSLAKALGNAVDDLAGDIVKRL
jgi:uncharacterized protein